MKKLTISIFALLFIQLSNAQDKLPSFGKIDKTDLEMKDCDFDPGAEALILIDVGEIEFSYFEGSGWISRANYRMRVKILNASALHRAEIKLHYLSRNRVEEIEDVNGISFNLGPSGNVIKAELEKKAIFRKAIDKDYTEISFALPEVKTGTVFEYKYTVLRKTYRYIPSWNFQGSIPVRYSAYNLIIPEYFQFTLEVHKRQEMEKKASNGIREGTWYIMHNIPALRDEPYSSGKKDYLQRIDFQLSKIQTPTYYEEVRTTWPKIISELLEDEDFGLAIKKNIRGTDELDSKLVNAKSNREKIRLVYNYVQNNMQWNNEYSKYSDNGIKDAWDKKNGNIADINFILIRLLRDAGIAADPLLASTKDNGTVNTVFPFLNQFNCVLAYFKDADGEYIMNAADKYNPFYLVPYDVLFCKGLLVDKKEGGLKEIYSDKNYSNNVYFSSNVDENGKISGNAIIGSSGYARNLRVRTYKKGNLKSLFESTDGIIVKIDSLSVNNLKDELLPLEQKLLFSGNIQSSGEYFFLPINLFSGLDKNPFIEEDRVMDIDFMYPKSYMISGTYILTDDYSVNELPKNTKMMLPDTSIVLTRVIQKDENIVSFRFTLDFKAIGYNAESYPYIREFFKKMYEILDERIVLKKK